MRIHIGRISPALAERIEELEKRLARYGTVEGKLSLHRKPYGDFYFAFADMDLDAKQYAALCAGLSNMMFRQSRLEVKQARPSPFANIGASKSTEASKEASTEASTEASKGASTSTSAHLNPQQQRRAKSVHPWRANVFPGRLRQGLREPQTFRVLIGGRLRRLRMTKRKMWGVEKRPLSRLVSRFENGEWLDGEERVVAGDEYTRDLRIAEDVAASAAVLSDSDFEEFLERERSNAPNVGGNYMQDDDMEIEYVSNEPAGGEHTSEPAIGAKKSVAESLRSALSADAPFTLFSGTTSEPVAGAIGGTESVAPVVAPSVAPVVAAPKYGLFFAHKSPYLRSQTQASRITAEFDANAWNTEFHAKRGEWRRELRQRRRDAQRQARRMGKRRGE